MMGDRSKRVIKTAPPDPQLTDLFGLTRFGKHFSPKAVITGRHEKIVEEIEQTEEEELKKPKSSLQVIGKDKPHAIIISRKQGKKDLLAPEYQDISGFTRFGRANPPRPVILSRPIIIERPQPGPGAYDLDKCDDCKIGISISGKNELLELDESYDLPGPNQYEIPSCIGKVSYKQIKKLRKKRDWHLALDWIILIIFFIKKGPAYTFGSKFPDMSSTSCSPGPIYKVVGTKKRGKSLTFKPFPMAGDEDRPGPLSYPLSGEQAIKSVLKNHGAYKFGKGHCPTCDYTILEQKEDGPGPGAYDVTKCETKAHVPNALIISRRPVNYSQIGAGELVDISGKTRFGAPGRKNAVLASRHYLKEKTKTVPGCYDLDKMKDRRIGIKLKSRAAQYYLGSDSPGPNAYLLQSTIGQGPAFSLGPKFRGEMPKLDKVPPPLKSEKKDECEPLRKPSSLTNKNNRTLSPPPPGTIKFSVPTDPYEIIPLLENMCLNY